MTIIKGREYYNVRLTKWQWDGLLAMSELKRTNIANIHREAMAEYLARHGITSPKKRRDSVTITINGSPSGILSRLFGK